WAEKMRAGGHRILDEVPGEDDRRYIKLAHRSDFARSHQDARLSCEAWSWDHGRPVRYCTDPKALVRSLSDRKHLVTEGGRHQEHQRAADRESARDAAVRAWVATSARLEIRELVALARERIHA